MDIGHIGLLRIVVILGFEVEELHVAGATNVHLPASGRSVRRFCPHQAYGFATNWKKLKPLRDNKITSNAGKKLMKLRKNQETHTSPEQETEKL